VAKTVYSPQQRAAWMRDWRKRNPDKERATQRRAFLKRRYGLTPEEYQAMVVAQEGRCAICRREARELVVDHNHATKVVRALLCDQCNVMLGMAGESVETLQRAIAYLS
jgi:hypothetical protein